MSINWSFTSVIELDKQTQKELKIRHVYAMNDYEVLKVFHNRLPTGVINPTAGINPTISVLTLRWYGEIKFYPSKMGHISS